MSESQRLLLVFNVHGYTVLASQFPRLRLKSVKVKNYMCVFSGCALCRLNDDDPAMFGEKVTLREHKFSVHYLCLVCLCSTASSLLSETQRPSEC